MQMFCLCFPNPPGRRRSNSVNVGRWILAVLLVLNWLNLTATLPASATETPGTLVAPPRAHTFGVRRVTSRQLRLLRLDIELRNPGGIAATRLRSTDDTQDAGDDDELTLVAVDRDLGHVMTNAGLLRVMTWSGEGTELGALDYPWDVAIDRDGRVGVTDTGNQRVVLLQHDGNSLMPVDSFSDFHDPRGIAADGAGGFWICDAAANAVVHLDTATRRRTTFGLEVGFERPLDVAAVAAGEPLARGRRPAVAVVDRDGRRLRLFGSGGALRATRNAESLGIPDAAFDAVAIDYYGNVLAVDQRGHRIHKFRHDLLPLDSFGEFGTRPGQFDAPRGIAIYRRLGQVFIAENEGGQYLWVGTDIRHLAAESRGEIVAIQFLLTETSLVNATVVNTGGKAVRRLLREDRREAGPQELSWDGKDDAGKQLARGAYQLLVTARATYASKSTFERKRTTVVVLERGGGAEAH